LGILFLAIVDLIDIIQPLIIMYAVDDLSKPNAPSILLWYAIIYMGLGVLQGRGRFWYRIFFFGPSYKIARDIRNELFSHLQTLSSNYFNRTYTGDIMSRATSDIEAVRQFYAMGMFIGADLIVYVLTVPVIMFFLNVKLTLLSLVLLPALPFFVNRMGNLIHNRFKKIQETAAEISTYSQENFAGIRVVKSFAQEENQKSGFKQINDKYVDQNLSIAKVESVFSPTLQFIAAASVLIVLYFGGKEVIGGTISDGTFVAFTLYMGRLLWPMMALGWTISIFQRSSASMQRLQEIFGAKAEIISPPQPVAKKLEGAIEFKNVGLAYQGLGSENTQKEPALQGVNLKIPAGKTVAIMGPVGCGKTSLINLIPRLFDPTEGSVLIDGVDLRQYDLGDLRKQIGFAPQDVFLFSESIKENIGLGIQDYKESDIQRIVTSAKLSMVGADIEGLPGKYETLLGERGVNLSGGQKQRITIARALAKKPKILILDDCFASVDVDTESLILDEFQSVLPDLTTIIISHRLPVVKVADIIVFMEKGQVVETGSHSELLARKGRYADFYRQQQLITDLEKIE
jgi:ATP-binding cassette subfamily B protein